MRYGVAIPAIKPGIQFNLDKVLAMIRKAEDARADILLFPEAVLTGLNISGEYEIDRRLALTLDSAPIQKIIQYAYRYKIWTAFGFLELAGGIVYDSVLLVNSEGEIILHYRRISPGWRVKNANHEKYGCGESLITANTPWGKTAIFICGDLFEPAIVQKTKAVKPDLLLFPFARSFSQEISNPQRQWDNVEWPHYAAAIKAIGAFTLMSNYITTSAQGGYFGGGYIVNRDGKILKAQPLYEEGLLLWDDI